LAGTETVRLPAPAVDPTKPPPEMPAEPPTVERAVEAPVHSAVVCLEPERPVPGLNPVRRGAALTIGADGRFDVNLTAGSRGAAIFLSNSSGGRTWNISCPTPGNTFDLGALPPGRSASQAIAVLGPIEIVARSGEDEIRAVVYSTASPHFAVVRNGGVFRFESVPSGRWQLVGWARGWTGRAPALPMNLRNGETVRQDLLLQPTNPAP